QISAPSYQSLLVTAIANGVEVGMGTAFVVAHDNQYYLVTNYHVAAGRDPSTGQPVHLSGAVPDTLRVRYTVSVSSEEIEWEDRDETVLNAADDRALWLEHPRFGRSVDVVAIRLDSTSGLELHPHDLTGTSRTLRARPSDGLSIVSFPFGVTAGKSYGVWT